MPEEPPQHRIPERAWLRHRGTALTGIVVLAAFGGLWLTGSAVTAPVRTEIRDPPGRLRAMGVSFPSESGAEIAAWYGAPQPGEPTVVLSHGIYGSRRQLVDRALFLREAHYGVLLYDAQGHGESTGDRITFGYLEAHDAAAAVAFVRTLNPSATVGFLGPSGRRVGSTGPRASPR
jgi:pimeloyl-ACP methyl ester carboxylesterase